MRKKETFSFLEKLQGRGIKLGLRNIERFLRFISSPEKKFKSIHVAGTNGKGSTAAMVESILRQAGYKTGLYTSPHLVRFNERIQVSGKCIGDRQLANLVSELKQEMHRSKIDLTYFEFVTAMAFKHFAHCRVDFAVVEVGMGGRLDATNVVKSIVSVITNVESEHEQHLGKTVEKIAAEKAGIVKEGIPVVTAEWKETVLRVLRKKCREKKARLAVVRKPFLGRLKMLGSFQKWNAATAVAVAGQMQKQGIEISKSAIEKGLALAKWPGRFDVVQQNPTVVLDCAHNPACCVVLAKAFGEIFPGKKALLVIGVSKDKKIDEMSKRLSSLAKKVFATGARYRAMDLKKVANAFELVGSKVEVVYGVENAVRKAVSSASENDVILVTGSCFVVGEALKTIK